MKKIMKHLVTAAVLMIVAGIVLLALGSKKAGSIEQVRDAVTAYEFYFQKDGVHLSFPKIDDSSNTGGNLCFILPDIRELRMDAERE